MEKADLSRHEDLKPQNVLIHCNDILLTDFGFR